AFDIDGDFLGQIAIGHSGGDIGDVAHLSREVTGHEIDADGQILPRSGHALHLCLAAELPFRTDLTGDARNFGGKRTKLVNHGVDDVYELQNFAADIDGDLLRQVAGGDGGRHF